MILNAILVAIQKLIGLLLKPIVFPNLPDGVADAITSMMSHVKDGLTIIAAFTHFQFLTALFFAALAIEAIVLVYKFIRWIIQKLPVSME